MRGRRRRGAKVVGSMGRDMHARWLQRMVRRCGDWEVHERRAIPIA